MKVIRQKPGADLMGARSSGWDVMKLARGSEGTFVTEKCGTATAGWMVRGVSVSPLLLAPVLRLSMACNIMEKLIQSSVH